MELILRRLVLTNTNTQGKLYIDGKYFCETIEDKVRAKAGFWKRIFKIYAKTAIPYGRYPVLVTWSNKFQRMLTGIFNVPDYEGIRIHNGVSELSSAGCIIVSYQRQSNGSLVNDKSAMNDLCSDVTEAQKTGKIFITITN